MLKSIYSRHCIHKIVKGTLTSTLSILPTHATSIFTSTFKAFLNQNRFLYSRNIDNNQYTQQSKQYSKDANTANSFNRNKGNPKSREAMKNKVQSDKNVNYQGKQVKNDTKFIKKQSAFTKSKAHPQNSFKRILQDQKGKKLLQEQKNNGINSFNIQIQTFIEQSKGWVDELSQEKQVKSTWSSLSNLYRIIIMKSQYFKLNPIQALNTQNKMRISILIKSKMKGNFNFQNWHLPNHQEIIDTVYLSEMISQRNNFSNIQSQFLQYLRQLQKEETYFEFIFKMSHQPIPNSKDVAYLSIDVDKLRLNPFVSTNFPFEIIKAIAQSGYRNSNEFFNSLKSLSRLLSLKQLKLLDELVNQVFLIPTQQCLISRTRAPVGDQKLQKIFTVDEVSKISSILSQLNLKGNSLLTCQGIFEILLQSQISDHQNTYKEIKALLIPQKTKSATTISVSTAQSKIKFNNILKFYIAIAQLRAVEKTFERAIQKLFVYKFLICQAINNGTLSGLQPNNVSKIVSKYTISKDEVFILISAFHKFKKGNQIYELCQQGSTDQKIINSKQSIVRNVWVQVFRFLNHQSRPSIPEQFIFPVLSGIYRSLRSHLVLKLYKKEQMAPQISNACLYLMKKLYQVDQQVSYIKELSLEKLIEFVIVFQAVTLASCFKQVSSIQNQNKQKNAISFKGFFIDFIEKLKAQLQKNEQFSANEKTKETQMAVNQFDVKSNVQSKSMQKERQIMFATLQFYLSYSQLHAQFAKRIVEAQDRTQKEKESVQTISKDNRNNDKSRNINKKIQSKTTDNSNNVANQRLSQIKKALRRMNFNQTSLVLVSQLIKNSLENAKNLCQIFQKAKLRRQSQLCQQLIKHYYDLQSFIGFTSKEEGDQYLTSLQLQAMNNGNLQLQFKQNSSEDGNFFNEPSFERFILNHILLTEQLIRVRLIQSQQDFQQYQNINNHSDIINEIQ